MSRPRPNRSIPVLLPLCALLGCALGSCADLERKEEESVEWNLHHMNYGRALELAQAGVAQHPGDPQAEELLRRSQVAALLEKGRRLTLEDDDLAALQAFQQGVGIDPHSPELAEWIEKTELKLGDRWLQVALEQHARGDLAGALDAYEQSLRYHPGYEVAIAGMGQAVREIEHREKLSHSYFEGGVHALSDYWLERARALFAYSNKYKPGQAHTTSRTKQVNLLLAQQRQKVAQDFESRGLFGAARGEYRMALALAPDDQPSKEALERCTREVQAQRKLEDANYQLLRGEFDRASKLLDEGEALTTAQQDLFKGARDKILEVQHQRVYDSALALERDQRYTEAIAKYEELLAQAEYFKDSLARLDTLKGYVALADDLYQKAQAAPDDAARADLLKQILLFWPEYRDAAKLVAELEHKPGS